MRFVDNGIPEDYARLTFEGMSVPLCELSDEEYARIVWGIDNYKPRERGKNGLIWTVEESTQNPKLSEDIVILELSVRANNCLRRAGINTVGELVAITEQALYKIRNMGFKSVKEVKEKLEIIGLALKKSED